MSIAFDWTAPSLRIGEGCIDEVGGELAALGARRVLLFTDAGVRAAGWPDRVAESARSAGIDCVVYDQVRIEPDDASITSAVEHARDLGPFQAVVAVGGGSSIDTAKAVSLLLTSGGVVHDYLNAPLGRAQPPRAPLLPLVAVPTTAGTGSECTAVAVVDLRDRQVKTGISHPSLRPTRAFVDPQVTVSLPPGVTAASGMDVLGHALEAYTARPYTSLPPAKPGERVYWGANPISDVWVEQALALLARALRQAVTRGDDLAARTAVMLAATYAGMGFGNAGVHIPHAAAYPIAGQVRDYKPAGYPTDHPMIPHGQAVSLTTPATFRTTFPTSPERHVRAAEILDPTTVDLDPPERLPTALVRLMRDIRVPSGLAEVGYGENDLDTLVAGTLQQERILALAPLPPTSEDLHQIMASSLHNW
ncbi:MAG TPA: hydroxyacid-oxoacid transhydrogenase [Actinopolymorphaceae bacterium]|jgi:alcohol dehydrogenase class IV